MNAERFIWNIRGYKMRKTFNRIAWVFRVVVIVSAMMCVASLYGIYGATWDADWNPATMGTAQEWAKRLLFNFGIGAFNFVMAYVAKLQANVHDDSEDAECRK